MATNSQEIVGRDSTVCPVCRSNGSEPCDTLVLRQISATEAIYVCSNPTCVYPVGHEAVFVKRTVEEMMPDYENISIPEEDNGKLDRVIWNASANLPGSHHAAGDKSEPQESLENWFNDDDLLDPDIGDWLDSQTY